MFKIKVVKLYETNTVELGYNVMKGTEYLFCVVITEYNITVNREELIGTTEKYLTL
jgi:hypothetical protein